MPSLWPAFSSKLSQALAIISFLSLAAFSCLPSAAPCPCQLFRVCRKMQAATHAHRVHSLRHQDCPSGAARIGLIRAPDPVSRFLPANIKMKAQNGVSAAVQYVTAEWELAFLRQAREFLFFPLLPRRGKQVSSYF